MDNFRFCYFSYNLVKLELENLIKYNLNFLFMEFNQGLTNFSDRMAGSLPNVIGALLILLIGWLIAKGVQKLIVNLLQRTSWDERLLKGVTDGKDTNVFVGKLVYYLLMIIVFLIVLENLGIRSVLSPLERMVDEFLGFIPRLIAAGIIGFIGYMLAKFVSSLVAGAGAFIGRMVQKVGINKPEQVQQVIKVLRTFVFVVIFIPLLIQAINALQLYAIGDPLNQLLHGFVGIIGNVIVAAIILTIFIWGGKLLTDFLKGLFINLGVDELAVRIRLQGMIGATTSLSKLVANVLYFFIVFFGVITALEMLQLDQLTFILDQILDITGSIAFGALILLIGNYIGMLVYNAMLSSKQNKFVATVVRIAVLGLFIGISLRAMGIANEIVDLAFGLTLGSLAVVVALAYGLGGREAAGEHFKEILQKFKGEDRSDDISRLE